MTRGAVVVIGGGVMGCATARALARRGVTVTLLEQFEVGHRRGSSHGSSRIFRLSYPDARYVAMGMEALPLWRDLEREANEPLLKTTGGLDRGADLGAHAEALAACGAPFESVSADQAQIRWPQLSFPSDTEVLYQPDAGIVLAERAVAAFARGLVDGGGELREGVRVVSITPSATGVRLDVPGGSLTADSVVVTAGAWARKLVEGVGIDVPTRPTRETVAYFDYQAPPPPTLVEWSEPPIYALSSPEYGLKVGEHEAGPTTDPDDEGSVSEASLERVCRWVAERFPAAASRPTHAETCLYTNTPDDHFILKRYGRVVVGSPCSGHGFKFAPLIGEQLADLAQQAIG